MMNLKNNSLVSRYLHKEYTKKFKDFLFDMGKSDRFVSNKNAWFARKHIIVFTKHQQQ